MTDIQVRLTEFSDLIDSYTADFVGRGWLVDKINSELAEPDCRFVLITGDPGMGKTAFLAHLAKTQPRWLRYFIRRDSKTLLRPGDANTFLQTVGRQFATLYPRAFDPKNLEIIVRQRVGSVEESGSVIAARIEELHASPFYRVALQVEQEMQRVAGDVVGIEIGRLIAEPRLMKLQDLQYMGLLDPAELLWEQEPEIQVVILVDALDELRYRPAETDILRALSELPDIPPNIRFIVSSRPERFLKELLSRDDAREVPLIPTEPGNQSDLRNFARGVVRDQDLELALKNAGVELEDFMDDLLAKAAGNFLYLESVLTGIQVAASDPAKRESLVALLRVNELPDDLGDLYDHFLTYIVRWTEQKMGPRAWREYLQPFLGVLAVAQEPLTETQVLAFTGLERQDLIDLRRDLQQFIRYDTSRSPSYRIYHTSMAEYLLDADQNDDYWIDGQVSHARISTYYWTTYGAGWGQYDDYGLRHFTQHISSAGPRAPAGFTEILTADFIRAKSGRFGTLRSVLNDVSIAISEARGSHDMPQLLRWTWLHTGLRDRMAQSVVPEALALYVKLGRVDDALEMIESLDRNTFGGRDRDTTLERMTNVLAEQGKVDQALMVAETITTTYQRQRAIWETARTVARADRSRALQIIQQIDYSAAEADVEFCRILAQDENFIEKAVEIARGSGAALKAIAVEVAGYDLKKALALIPRSSTYREDSAGMKWTRMTYEGALAEIVLRLSEKDPRQGTALINELHDGALLSFALLGSIGPVARAHPEEAFPFLDRVTRKFRDDTEFAFTRALALACIAAHSNQAGIQKEVRRRWVGMLEWFGDILENEVLLGLHEDKLDILAHVVLVPLREHPLGREIAWKTVQMLWRFLKRLIAEDEDLEYDHDTGACIAMACALAIFDLDQAIECAKSWKSSTGNLKDETLLMVVKTAARFDPEGAIHAIQHVEGYYQHLAWMAALDIIARYDFEQALSYVDGIDDRFAMTKSAALGVLGNTLDVEDKRQTEELLSRFPQYVSSAAFRYPLLLVGVALAAEVARGDFHQGMRLGDAYLAAAPEEYRSDVRDRFLAQIAGSAAKEDPSKISDIISRIGDELDQAVAYLNVARSAPIEKRRQYLESAAALSARVSDALGEKDGLVSGIASQMLALSPGEALAVAYHIPRDFEREKSITSIFQAALRVGRDMDELIDMLDRVLKPIYERGDPDMALGKAMEMFRKYDQLLWILGPLLNEMRLSQLSDWFYAQNDPFAATMLRTWNAAATDPDTAFAILEDDDWISASRRSKSWVVRRAFSALPDVDSWRKNWRKEILFKRASTDPFDALERYKAAYRDGVDDPDREFLFDLVQVLATHSVKDALEAAEDKAWGDEEDSRYTVLQSQALAAIARAEAARDWRHALEIARRIPDRWSRFSALEGIVNSLSGNPPSSNEVKEAYSGLIAEMEKIHNPQYRQSAFEALLRALRDYPVILPDVTAELIAKLGNGSTETFFALLPELVRLICKEDEDLAHEIEGELEHIKMLLAA
jgi:hypothetical protein